MYLELQQPVVKVIQGGWLVVLVGVSIGIAAGLDSRIMHHSVTLAPIGKAASDTNCANCIQSALGHSLTSAVRTLPFPSRFYTLGLAGIADQERVSPVTSQTCQYASWIGLRLKAFCQMQASLHVCILDYC